MRVRLVALVALALAAPLPLACDAPNGAARSIPSAEAEAPAGAPDDDGGGGAALAGDAGAPAPLDTSELDAVVAAEMKAGDLPGVTLAIARQGAIVAAKAYGLADRAKGAPMNPSTLLEIASISKTITGTALMQLAEQGKVSLDADVSTYAGQTIRNPSFPSTPITLRMLLTHTSSLRSNDAVLDPAFGEDVDTPLALADLPRQYFVAGGRYYSTANFSNVRPGTTWDYCNVCIALVGAIVEKVSGQPFEAYTKDHVFTPLGMTSTTWRLADTDRARLATPYATNPQTKQKEAAPHFGLPDWPAGGLKTTASDLARFMIAIAQRGAKVLSPASVDAMLTPAVPASVHQGQGLVFYEPNHDIPRVWGHSGSLPGISTTAVLEPGTGDAVVVMVNTDWTYAVAREADEPIVKIEAKAMELARR